MSISPQLQNMDVRLASAISQDSLKEAFLFY